MCIFDLSIINYHQCCFAHFPHGGSAHFFTYQLLTVINVVLHTSTLGGFAQLMRQPHATSCHQFSCGPSKNQNFCDWLWSGCLQKGSKDQTGPDFKTISAGVDCICLVANIIHCIIIDSKKRMGVEPVSFKNHIIWHGGSFAHESWRA